MNQNSRKSLIFCAYADDESMKSGENIKKITDRKSLYLKNAVVALVSAKINNPLCDVGLVTNIIPDDDYKSLLARHDIKIYYEKFDEFRFADDYKWGLAFYKLCALKKIMNYNYDRYLFLDADTYTQSNFDDLWEETDYNIMLHNHIHRLTIPDCKKYNEEVEKFCGMTQPITNYSGGFIAGSDILLSRFMKTCCEIFDEMIEKNFYTSFGDEFILRLAAERMKENIKEANAYIETFWTSYSFYLTTTRYKYNAISIFHLPNEKNSGLKKVFKYIKNKEKLPDKGKFYALCNIKHRNLLGFAKYIMKNIMDWRK